MGRQLGHQQSPLKQPFVQRKVFAILDDPSQPERGHSTCVFVNNGDTLGEALRKLNEQQALAVWSFHVSFVGITTKEDRLVRGGHLLKSCLDLNINDVMLEEDYLVVCPSGNTTAAKNDTGNLSHAESAVAAMKPSILGKMVVKQENPMEMTVEKSEEDKSGKWSMEEDEKLIAGLLKYGEIVNTQHFPKLFVEIEIKYFQEQNGVKSERSLIYPTGLLFH